MKYFLLFAAILSVLSQLPHAYWMIDYVSNIPDKYKIPLRIIQNVVFCMIISASIIVLVYLELHIWAAAAVFIEIAINFYYTYCSFEEKYIRTKSENIIRKKRELVGSYFLGVLIPLCIFVFSWLYTQA